MKAHFLAGAVPILMDSSSLSTTTPLPCGFGQRRWMYCRSRSRGRSLVAAVNGRQQNHYAVLGVSDRASSVDIKRAYRLLARKYHPDVSKEAQAGEIFKRIHHAYEVLSDDIMRAKYDRSLKFEVDNGRAWTVNRNYYPGYEDEVRIYRWAELRRRMQNERYWEDYDLNGNDSSDGETDEVHDEEASHEERGSFIEVLRSAFVSLFMMQTLGCRLSLTFSGLTALLDRKLDAGYKLGYMIAWLLGGRGGILLTMCLSFASWVCGKTSSSIVVLVVVAMWIGSNLARYAPLPQGAILTLLYMSVKLQIDMN